MEDEEKAWDSDNGEDTAKSKEEERWDREALDDSAYEHDDCRVEHQGEIKVSWNEERYERECSCRKQYREDNHWNVSIAQVICERTRSTIDKEGVDDEPRVDVEVEVRMA